MPSDCVPIKALQKIVFKEEMARAKDEMLGAKREVEEIEMEGGEEANSVEPILEGYNVYAQETMALFFQIVLIYFLTAWRNEIVIPIECARGKRLIALRQQAKPSTDSSIAVVGAIVVIPAGGRGHVHDSGPAQITERQRQAQCNGEKEQLAVHWSVGRYALLVTSKREEPLAVNCEPFGAPHSPKRSACRRCSAHPG